jgi:hypothetical protein
MKTPLKIHFGLLAMAFAALVVSIGLYWYLYHDTLSLTDHTLTARTAAATEVQREKEGLAIKRLASTTETSRPKIVAMFVPADDAVSFIQAMESVGASSGATVSISALSESSPSSAKAVTGSVSARVSINGSWQNVMNALQQFEVLPYSIKINNLNLNVSTAASNDKAGAPKAWEASFDISAATLI